MSQLVMRSFDVSDKGEVSKNPLGMRGERTSDHHQQRRRKGNKVKDGVGGGRGSTAPHRTDRT